MNTRITSDEDYIKAYVGDKYNKLKKENISFPSLLLGPLYLVYRKLTKQGLLILLIYLLLYYYTTFNITAFCIILTNILLCFKFNKYYIEEAERKTNEIKLSNPDKTSNELLIECQKKGKLSKTLVIILIILIIIFLSYTSSKEAYKDIYNELYKTLYNVEDVETIDDYEEDESLDELEYIIPNNFKEGKYNYSDYKYYNYIKNNNICSITVLKYTYINNTTEEFLKTHLYSYENEKISDIESIYINDNKWKKLSQQYTDYYTNHYAIKIENIIYEIEYKNYTNSNVCKNYETEFINTLKIKNN
jgi:hypothetical protein